MRRIVGPEIIDERAKRFENMWNLVEHINKKLRENKIQSNTIQVDKPIASDEILNQALDIYRNEGWDVELLSNVIVFKKI